VISVDLQDFRPIEGATILSKSDFTLPATQEAVLKILSQRGKKKNSLK
jgi:hypothetical protein